MSDLIVIFPSNVFSGHEKMALKIIETAQMPIKCIVHHAIAHQLNASLDVQSYANKKQLLSGLFKYRMQLRNRVVVLVSGSPYGFALYKLIIRLFGFKLIDYIPMPELKEMKDRPHHYLMPYVNKLLVNQRILIDDWQIQYSAVKKCLIIKNIV